MICWAKMGIFMLRRQIKAVCMEIVLIVYKRMQLAVDWVNAALLDLCYSTVNVRAQIRFKTSSHAYTFNPQFTYGFFLLV